MKKFMEHKKHVEGEVKATKELHEMEMKALHEKKKEAAHGFGLLKHKCKD